MFCLRVQCISSDGEAAEVFVRDKSRMLLLGRVVGLRGGCFFPSQGWVLGCCFFNEYNAFVDEHAPGCEHEMMGLRGEDAFFAYADALLCPVGGED